MQEVQSIYFSERIDLVIVLSVLVLITAPVVISYIYKAGFNKQTELFLSPRCEELFGREWTETLLREFEELNPDLKIKPLNTADEKSKEPANSAESDSSKTVKRVSVPDILIFDEGEFSGLVASNALMSLEPYFEQENGALMLAVPLASFMDLLFYNVELLKAAGFDRPPKTREEFLSYAKAVSRGNVSGAAVSLSPEDRQALSRDIFSWVWAAGGDFWLEANLSQNAQGPVINSRPIVRDISFLGSLYREGVLAPEAFEMTGKQRLEEFAKGKIAMMIASTRAIPYLREKMGDDAFGITTIPGSGSAGKYSLGLSGFYAGINNGCKHPDKAGAFLSFLAEKSPLLCAELKAVPGVVSDLFSGDYMKDDPFYSKARDIFESSEVVQGFSKIPAAEEFEGAVREEIQIFFESNRTAQETAAAIQRRWDAFFIQDDDNDDNIEGMM